MNIYFEPVNVNQWNMFEKVEEIGHIEPFLAVSTMETGDLMLLHVGQQNKQYKSGVYAFGEIVRAPFILKDHPEDYCNNKSTVLVKITKIDYKNPYITRQYMNNFLCALKFQC